MYVQPTSGEQSPLQIPGDYSGNAFAPPPALQQTQPPQEQDTERNDIGEQAAPPMEGEAAAVADEVHRGAREDAAPEDFAPEAEAREAFLQGSLKRGHEGPSHGGGGGGLLGRFSFLSSLFPPARGRGKDCERGGGHGELLEWVIIGLALLFFLDDSADDILPLLLLLLLWE